MKKILLALTALAVLATGLGFDASPAEAKRLGGGRSFGMQRSAPAPTQPALTPKPASPQQGASTPAANPAAATAAQAGKRSWAAPLAGLAAGLGIAALLSHFGLGEEMAGFVMIALLVMAALMVFRLLFRRTSPTERLQYAGAGSAATRNFEPIPSGPAGTTGTASAATVPVAVPDGFDIEGFLRQAKLNFIRLQAANDRGNMDDIRNFTAPEVFAEIQLQYEERGRTTQQTDLVTLEADLLEVAEQDAAHLASVRFHGLVREEVDASPVPFDEIWHLAKPLDGSRGWVITGIQQYAG